MSVREIAKKFKVAKSTVQDTIKADQKGRPHQKSKPRGAHRKTTIAEDRRIVRAAVLTPEGQRQPLHDIHINIAPHVSPSTIRRRLKEQRIRKWGATGRIKITDDIAKACLSWARKYRYWSPSMWEKKVIWSDESTVEWGDRKQDTWVFQYPDEKSYIKVLEEGLPAFLDELGERKDFLFMQDNAPIHGAHIVRDWYTEQGIQVMEWPP